VPRATRVAERNPDLVLAQLRLAQAHCDTGALAPAQRILDRLEADGFSRMPDNHTRFSALYAGAAVCAALGPARASKSAARLYTLLLPDAERILTFGTAAVCYGPAHLQLGLLALASDNRQAAVMHFRAARVRAQELAAPLWSIEAELGEAGALLSLEGDSPAVRNLLENTLAESQRLELKGFELRARSLLR
jgi:hypothetical protein